MKLLDTVFLIDLQREMNSGASGPAHHFLGQQADEEFAISVISLLEFLEGYEQTRDGEEFLEPFVKLEVSQNVSRCGSRIRRHLRQQGLCIGDFDILIAATALEADVELVTADKDHFARIDGLTLISYRDL